MSGFRVACTVLGALALGGAAGADELVPLGPCGPIPRPFEAIHLPAHRLRRLGGPPLERLALVAFRAGRGTAIPFQVDERRSRRVALPNGPEASHDDRPGVLEGEDLLVFMACDAGERAAPEAVAAALGAPTSWREVRLEDPLTGAAAFVYLGVTGAPPHTARRYVAYDPTVDMVRTARYRVGLVSALPNYLALGFGGSPGPNLLDGLRLRAEATVLASLAHMSLTERDGRHGLVAWRAGPLRVVRRSKHEVELGLGIHLSAGVAHTYFYPQHVYAPGSLKLPFSPGIFFRDIHAFGGADGRDLYGWRYFAPGTPADGFRIDGRMDAAELAFTNASGDWFALAHQGGAILFVTRLSEALARAIPMRLVYRDDAARAAAPETKPGTVPLVGYEGRDIQRLPGGRYAFALHIFGLPRFRPGDERRVIAELDHPVAADMSAAWPALPPRPDAGSTTLPPGA